MGQSGRMIATVQPPPGVRRLAAPIPDLSPGAWRRVETAEAAYDEADLDRAELDATLAVVGLDLVAARLVRHRAGDRGLPDLGGPFGFALDLGEGRAIDGGLLLFVDLEGRARGYRPERGALTVWPIRTPPLLTELRAGAPDRLTVIGSAR